MASKLRFVRIFRHFSTNRALLSPIISAETTNSGNCLKVGFFDEVEPFLYPSLFLQDNCTCPKCFHSSSQSRSRKMTQLDLDNILVKVQLDKVANCVKCEWSDGHLSEFGESWLKARRFAEENLRKRMTGLRDNPVLVGADYSYRIFRQRFHDVLTNPSSMLQILLKLCQTGVAIVSDAPKEVGQLRKLADAIGFIRLTHYGNEFTVKSEKNAVNLAYTSSTLCVHTDLPYYSSPPGVQLLHCIKQYDLVDDTEGGNSHLVDGFHIAQQMRENYPKEFRTLAEVPLEFYDVGKDYIQFHKVYHSPTFVVVPSDKLVRIVYSNQQLSSYQPIPLEQVDPVYKSLKLFTSLCYEEENLMKFKMKEGDILLFDNWRFLHGREGFDPNRGDRHLEGCYIDWDEIFSRINVLKAQS